MFFLDIVSNQINLFMKNSLVLTALLITQLFSSQTFGQVDSVASSLESQTESQLKKAGKSINSAGNIYNISAAVAIGGSTIGTVMIANGDTESGLILTSASGLISSTLQIIANGRLAKGGKQLYSTRTGTFQNDNTSNSQFTISEEKDKLTEGVLTLEIRPIISYRNEKQLGWSNEEQIFLGGANLKYSLNDYFIRLGVITGVARGITGSSDISRASFYSSRGGIIDFGTAFNGNEISLGATLSQWGDYNFINLQYSRVLKDNFSGGFGIHYDYEYRSSLSDSRLFPSVNLAYGFVLKKSKKL